MKTYTVTMHRIQQYDITVEADTPEDAEHKANDEVRINGTTDNGYANWETVSVEEEVSKPTPSCAPCASSLACVFTWPTELS